VVEDRGNSCAYIVGVPPDDDDDDDDDDESGNVPWPGSKDRHGSCPLLINVAGETVSMCHI